MSPIPGGGMQASDTVAIEVEVNGRPRRTPCAARTLLVHYLRETLGLTGTNIGCDTSSCGACTVLLDGESVKSCTVLAVQADGARGHHDRGAGRRRRRCTRCSRRSTTHHGLQCGYCTPGHGHGVGVAAATEHPSSTDRRGARRARGQPLPLHRLPQHRRRGRRGPPARRSRASRPP